MPKKPTLDPKMISEAVSQAFKPFRDALEKGKRGYLITVEMEKNIAFSQQTLNKHPEASLEELNALWDRLLKISIQEEGKDARTELKLEAFLKEIKIVVEKGDWSLYSAKDKLDALAAAYKTEISDLVERMIKLRSAEIRPQMTERLAVAKAANTSTDLATALKTMKKPIPLSDGTIINMNIILGEKSPYPSALPTDYKKDLTLLPLKLGVLKQFESTLESVSDESISLHGCKVLLTALDGHTKILDGRRTFSDMVTIFGMGEYYSKVMSKINETIASLESKELSDILGARVEHYHGVGPVDLAALEQALVELKADFKLSDDSITLFSSAPIPSDYRALIAEVEEKIIQTRASASAEATDTSDTQHPTEHSGLIAEMEAETSACAPSPASAEATDTSDNQIPGNSSALISEVVANQPPEEPADMSDNQISQASSALPVDSRTQVTNHQPINSTDEKVRITHKVDEALKTLLKVISQLPEGRRYKGLELYGALVVHASILCKMDGPINDGMKRTFLNSCEASITSSLKDGLAKEPILVQCFKAFINSMASLLGIKEPIYKNMKSTLEEFRQQANPEEPVDSSRATPSS